MENAGLICTNLCIDLGVLKVVDNVSFRLKPGAILLVKGQNGSGKSTLLRVLAGLLKPRSGEICFDGVMLNAVDDFGMKIAYLGHRLGLIPTLTVREMVHYWARMYDRRELTDASLHYFDLQRYADIAIHSLSAGWQQKLALSRLILSPAKLWLLDEPASHLDQEGSALLQSLLTARKEQGGMIALSMHGEVQAVDIQILNLDDKSYR
jgi:heme exporter protein A